MRFEQNPASRSPEQKQKYIAIDYKTFKKTEIPRDEVLEKAALILESNPQFPDKRGEVFNNLLARLAVREALKNLGVSDLDVDVATKQKDAEDVLALFKKK